MSVRQTMLFHAFLREPGSHSRARDTKGRVKALIEDLGLAQVCKILARVDPKQTMNNVRTIFGTNVEQFTNNCHTYTLKSRKQACHYYKPKTSLDY